LSGGAAESAPAAPAAAATQKSREEMVECRLQSLRARRISARSG
jgi:hypothetical protein